MSYTEKMFSIFVLISFFSFKAVSQENPIEMFANLLEMYMKSEYKAITIDRQSEGANMIIFDINKKISEDEFNQINLYSSMGQTQYLIYKKNGENIWYFHKEAYFYEKPMELENAEILNTYFIYKNDLPYAFNDVTGKYDIQEDTNKYQAVRDVRSLVQLIEIVQNTDSR